MSLIGFQSRTTLMLKPLMSSSSVVLQRSLARYASTLAATRSARLTRRKSTALATASHHVRRSHRHYSSSSSSSHDIPRTISGRNWGICIVPQESAWVIERFGKYYKVLRAGLHFLIPFIDRIAYIHNLKEQPISISNQQAITMDNVTINIDGVLYLKINNPELASYGVSDIYYAMTQLAQTTMRSELGKITLDKTFAERESLNQNIVHSINAAAEPWGVRCLRYEIRDISPPPAVKQAMDMQAEAERKKRATILDSEGAQQSEINVADGQRQATVLAAQGEASAILARAQATAAGIDILSLAIKRSGGREAVSLRIAEQYVAAFSQLAKHGNTILLPSNPADPAAMVAQAMSIYDSVIKRTPSAVAATNATDDDTHNRDEARQSIDLNDIANQYGLTTNTSPANWRPPMKPLSSSSSTLSPSSTSSSGSSSRS